MAERKNTSWSGVAGWYKDHLFGDDPTYHRTVILPNLTRLLGIKKDVRVLDLACGPGFFTREFVRQGALVVGVDISEELLVMARQMLAEDGAGPAKRAEFHASPSHDLKFLADGQMDAITVVTAIQNIERVQDTFRECARVLRPGGRLFVVMNHPCFRVLKNSSWGWDKDVQYRRIDAYLTEAKVKVQAHPGKNPDQVTISFHRPLQYYFKSLAKAGLCVSAVEEWTSDRISDSGPRAPAENRARKEIPLFLCLVAVKHGV